MSCYLDYFRKRNLLKPNSFVLWDDKKGKDQSWEAYFIDENLDPLYEGYGANKNEAINNLKNNILNELNKLISLSNSVEQSRFTVLE